MTCLVSVAPNKLPPRIESDYPKNVTAFLGEPAVFDCKWISDSNAMIEWGRFPLFNGSIQYESPTDDTPISEILTKKVGDFSSESFTIAHVRETVEKFAVELWKIAHFFRKQ